MLKQTKVSEKAGSFLSFCLYCGLGTAISLRKIHQNSRQLNLFDFSFETGQIFQKKAKKVFEDPFRIISTPLKISKNRNDCAFKKILRSVSQKWISQNSTKEKLLGR